MVQISGRLLLVFLTKLGIIYAAVLSTTDVNPNLTVWTSVSPIKGLINGTNTQTSQSIQIPLLDSNDSRNHLTINHSIDGKEINSTLNETNNSLTNVSTDPLFNGNGSNITNGLLHHSFDNFPTDVMPEWMRNNGGIVLHIFFMAYCCLGLGIICDLYFLPALEIISETLSLPPDIAGATFMAIGTSAPELFTSIIGVFVSQDDIGVGTILGTAVFNLIVIPAACGFAVMAFCPKTPKISRFPILRDSMFYILTIITLILCLKDNMVDWVESLILIGLFVIYLVIMYFNAQYSHLIKAEEEEEVLDDEKLPLLKDNGRDMSWDRSVDRSGTGVTKSLDRNGRSRSLERRALDKAHNEWNTFSLSTERKHRPRSGSQKRISFKDVEIEDEDDWIENNMFCKWFLLPLTLLFRITIPKPTKFCFLLTFAISVVWIGILTYACVWMVTIIGFTFGLPDTVTGLTLLAAGTSVPELISSVLVVKKASQADMAICNSIGSNIFDILFCLGVPWLLKSIIWMFQKGTIDLVATAVPIDSSALPLTTFSLLVTIFALIATFHFTDWKLGFTVGIICSIIYLLFVVISSFLEINLG